MEILQTTQPIIGALVIFLLRVADISLDTLRVLFVFRGKKLYVWVFGFVRSFLFVIAITTVLQNLDNPLNMIGYAAGFATGNVLGMFLEERLAVGFIHMTVISPGRGAAIAERLRDAGYAVTEVPARGKDGMVTMLNVNVRRRKVALVEDIVRQADENAFIIAEDIRPVRKGFWRA